MNLDEIEARAKSALQGATEDDAMTLAKDALELVAEVRRFSGGLYQDPEPLNDASKEFGRRNALISRPGLLVRSRAVMDYDRLADVAWALVEGRECDHEQHATADGTMVCLQDDCVFAKADAILVSDYESAKILRAPSGDSS